MPCENDRSELDWDDRPAANDGGLLGACGAVLRDVRTLTLDLAGVGTELARQVPLSPLEQLSTGLSRLEEVVLREVKSRLDQLEPLPPQPGVRRVGGRRTPAQLLDDLLSASIDADSVGSREELHRSLLLRLVPDEARLLAALADGTPYPLVHVRTKMNGGRTVLANASTIGRAAGIGVPDAVRTYVAHLRSLGLADEGPADDSLSVQYDILLGESEVRKAEQEARDAGRLGARVVRRTLRISALGSELWRACRPDDVVDPGPTTVSDTEALDSDGVAQVPSAPVPGPSFHPDTAYRSSRGVTGGSP